MRIIFRFPTLDFLIGSKLVIKPVPLFGDVDEGGRCAREDRVSLVEFLITQREFCLVESRWENVGGTYEFIARFDCTPVMANPTTIAQRFNAGFSMI